MALIREAEEWVGGDVFRGGGDDRYPIPGVSRWAGGAEASLMPLLAVWKIEEDE